MIMRILLDSIPEDSAVLRTPAAQANIHDANLRKLGRDMVETMRAARGVGLAANQVGVPVSMFVLDIAALDKSLGISEAVCVNPEIIDRHDYVTSFEGCLSFPGKSARPRRAASCTLQYYDPYDNVHRTIDASGMLAICIQHEYDHLLGKTMFESEQENV